MFNFEYRIYFKNREPVVHTFSCANETVAKTICQKYSSDVLDFALISKTPKRPRGKR